MAQPDQSDFLDPVAVLKKYWGHAAFRPMQAEIVQSVLAKNDTLALLPTGGGKSICFQVPALAMPGVCVVVSPLIALMNDQVANLKKLGVPAASVHSGMGLKEIDRTLEMAASGHLKFIYLSPERLQTDMLRMRLPRMNVNLLAIDEAHCISQWGYDFRPPYLLIAEARQWLPNVPVLALTATATPVVVADIQRQLQFKKQNVFQRSFHRPEVAYMVLHDEDIKGRMLRVLSRVQGTSVVYVRNRKGTKDVAAFLTQQGISATFYHAGLTFEERQQRQHHWITDQVRVMVATNAFGMGIDKPDVRSVIHLGFPDSLEAYFQEAGRAGRDGKNSFAVALVGPSTIDAMKLALDNIFPPKETIVNVYRALTVYLKLAEGTSEGQWFEVDLPAITRNYNINTRDLGLSLSLLQRCGFIELTEPDRQMATLRFTVRAEVLYEEQFRDDLLKRVTGVLLRSYSSLFDEDVPIDVALIAQRSGITVNQTEDLLAKLTKRKLAVYRKSGGLPRVSFVHGVLHPSNLRIGPEVYERRIEVIREQIKAVVQFLENNSVCRSTFLLAYFGEQGAKACGRCDVCLMLGKETVSESEHATIAQALREQLSNSPLAINELENRLRKWTSKKVLRVVQMELDSGNFCLGPNTVIEVG